MRRRYSKLDPELRDIIKRAKDGYLNLEEHPDLAKELLSLLQNKEVTAIEALDILDALSSTSYMPSKECCGEYEKWLQARGYRLTPSDVAYLTPTEAVSLLYNLFYNEVPIQEFLGDVLPLIIKKALLTQQPDELELVYEYVPEDLLRKVTR